MKFAIIPLNITLKAPATTVPLQFEIIKFKADDCTNFFQKNNARYWPFAFCKLRHFAANLILGTHAPAINFKSATVTEDGEEMDIIKARRFYPALEVLPIYQLNKNTSLSMYGIFGRGFEEEVATTNYFLSFRTDFNNIPLTKQLFLRLNPQIYYLRIEDEDSFYTTGSLTLAHRKWPLSVSTMMNKSLKSEIDVSDFEWNVGVTYAFGKTIAERKNATPAQVALAWVLAQKPWIVPIPGTTKLHRLTENNGAADIHFSKEELQELTAASEAVKVVGARYTEAQEAATGL